MRHGLDADLARALGESGCPVCRLMREAEDRYWDFFLYEGFQDPGAATTLRRTVGYCHRHLRQLRHHHDTFAGSSLAHASLEGALERLLDDSRRARVRSRRQPLSCPVCEHLAGYEQLALEALGRLLDRDEEVRAAYREHSGLCFAHLELALARRVEAADMLREHGARRLRRLKEDVQRLHESYRYDREPADAELAGSWLRAFRALRGDPGRIGEPRRP